MLAKIVNAATIAKAKGDYKLIVPKNEWVTTSRGLDFEKRVIDEMNNSGWEVSKPPFQEYQLCPGVRLVGRPDGLIVKSPTGEYDNTLLEVKFVKTANIKPYSVLQIQAYNVLYNMSVTLRTKDGFHSYIWGKYWSHIPLIMARNARRLKQFLELNSFADYERVIEIIVDKRDFSF
jgi:hypothetical protein